LTLNYSTLTRSPGEQFRQGVGQKLNYTNHWDGFSRVRRARSNEKTLVYVEDHVIRKMYHKFYQPSIVGDVLLDDFLEPELMLYT